jgi:hypothetical protein
LESWCNISDIAKWKLKDDKMMIYITIASSF